MPFEFVLFGMKFSKKSPVCMDVSNTKKEKMAKKLTPQQRKFKVAQAKCHKTTTSPKEFGSCMKEKLTKKKSKSKSKKK